MTLTDLEDDPSIYLLPREREECFKKACVEIFEDQLNGWYCAEELWPEDRSLQVFQLWFDYQLHSIVLDIGEEPLVTEDF